MIPPDARARIRRYFFVEHWKVGTIATELGFHPDTVRDAIEAPRFLNTCTRVARSQLDPFKPFLHDTLALFPRLRATRLLDMLRERGYAGGYNILRRWVRANRPRTAHEAFFALRALPGEQAQVDWGCFGTLRVGHAKRPLSCFVMTLAHSRAVFARFYLDQRLGSFLDGHVRAFAHFEGVPREVLYDNLKSVVLDRVEGHVRFHPQLAEFRDHYRYQATACAPYRPTEKGRVERTIRYLRERFFAARAFTDLDDLNAQLAAWLDAVALARTVPGDPANTLVRDALAAERPRLQPLPAQPFATDLVLPVHGGKQPYVRFDTNDYSIPHTHVGRALTLVVSPTQVRVLDGATELVAHPRCWDRRQRLEVRAHLDALAAVKRRAAALRGRDRLCAACPHANAFFEALAARGVPLHAASRRLGHLLDVFGPPALDAAFADAHARGAHDPSAIEHLVTTRARPVQALPVPLPLPERARAVVLPPPRLDVFASLTTPEDSDER